VGTKQRWALAADEAELGALRELGGAYPGQTVEYELAP
jgi:hypothetical protein